MEKTLILKNTDKAQTFIDKLEDKYLPVLNGIISGVIALDLPVPSKNQVKKILNDDFSELSASYYSLVRKDTSGFKTSALKSEMAATAGKKLEAFKQKTRKLLSGTIDHYKVCDVFFQDLFEINEDGMAYISDEGLEKIDKTFEERVSDTKFIKVNKKLEAAGTALQDLWDTLVSTGIATRMAPFANNPKQLIINLFEVESTEQEDDEGITLNHKIVPRKLNFEYLLKS